LGFELALAKRIFFLNKMTLGQMLLGKEILSYKQPMPVHYFKKSNKKPTSLQKKMLKLQCQNQISSNWVSYSSELSLAPLGD